MTADPCLIFRAAIVSFLLKYLSLVLQPLDRDQLRLQVGLGELVGLYVQGTEGRVLFNKGEPDLAALCFTVDIFLCVVAVRRCEIVPATRLRLFAQFLKIKNLLS
jgi:hypothetical protein